MMPISVDLRPALSPSWYGHGVDVFLYLCHLLGHGAETGVARDSLWILAEGRLMPTGDLLQQFGVVNLLFRLVSPLKSR